MKMNPAAKFSLLAMLALTAAFIAGCKSTPPVDWNSRIGTYTYDQAVTDLGPPDKQAKLDNGQMVAEWITHHSGGSGLSLGTGFFSGGGGSGVGVGVGVGVCAEATVASNAVPAKAAVSVFTNMCFLL